MDGHAGWKQFKSPLPPFFKGGNNRPILLPDSIKRDGDRPILPSSFLKERNNHPALLPSFEKGGLGEFEFRAPSTHDQAAQNFGQ